MTRTWKEYRAQSYRRRRWSLECHPRPRGRGRGRRGRWCVPYKLPARSGEERGVPSSGRLDCFSGWDSSPVTSDTRTSALPVHVPWGVTPQAAEYNSHPNPTPTPRPRLTDPRWSPVPGSGSPGPGRWGHVDPPRHGHLSGASRARSGPADKTSVVGLRRPLGAVVLPGTTGVTHGGRETVGPVTRRGTTPLSRMGLSPEARTSPRQGPQTCRDDSKTPTGPTPRDLQDT